MNKAIFLDRDGTINVEKNFLYKINDFEFIQNVPEAIKTFNSLNYKVIVITNQSGIARGYYTEEDLKKLHSYIDAELKKYDAKIDAYYYCPHNFEHGIGKYKIDCKCRKPNTGMFEQAINDFNIDTENSWMLGDRISDIIPAQKLNLNCGMVLTGYGEIEMLKLNGNIKIFPDLYHMSDFLKVHEKK